MMELTNEMWIRCPQCSKAGKRSTVVVADAVHYDMDGKPDPYKYSCSAGHYWNDKIA